MHLIVLCYSYKRHRAARLPVGHQPLEVVPWEAIEETLPYEVEYGYAVLLLRRWWWLTRLKVRLLWNR
jgi:hypothetical protein